MKTIDINVWNAATIYVANRIVTDRVCVGCGSSVLKSDSEEYEYQCLMCDQSLQEHEIVEIPDCNVSACEFGELVAQAYDYMMADKGRKTMTEREKIIKIIEKWAERTITTRVWGAGVSNPYNAAELADALIEARVRDITGRGWIFMNGEAIVPTPEIYNKVAELLGCPKIEDGMNNE